MTSPSGIIHQFNWNINCHKVLLYLYKVNNVFNLCIHREYLVMEKYIENINFQKYYLMT